MRARCVNAAASQQKITNHRIPEVPLQPRNSAETRHQAQAQLGKGETRHLVGDDQIAYQRQFEAPAERHPVDGSNRGQRRGVDGVQHAMDALQKVAHACKGLGLLHLLRTTIELAEVGPGTEAGLHGAVHDQGMGMPGQSLERLREFFQFFQRERSDFIAGAAVQREFDHAVCDSPRDCLALKSV